MQVSVKYKRKQRREVFSGVSEVREHNDGHLILVFSDKTKADIAILKGQWASRERVSPQ